MPPPSEQPPRDGASRIANAISDYAAVARPYLDSEIGGGAMEVTAPIPVYGLGMPDPDSAPSTILARTKRVAWRYLVPTSLGPKVADIRANATHPVLNEEPALANNIVEAGKVAEISVGNDPAYELRLLDLPVLGQSFLWAASGNPSKPDRLFSLVDKPAEVNVTDIMERASTAERQKGVAFASGTEESGG